MVVVSFAEPVWASGCRARSKAGHMTAVAPHITFYKTLLALQGHSLVAWHDDTNLRFNAATSVTAAPYNASRSTPPVAPSCTRNTILPSRFAASNVIVDPGL